MKLPMFVTLLAASSILATGAHATNEVDAVAAPRLEAVDHIPALGRIHSWQVVDRDSLIIWATPFKPYLVRLDHPSHDLRFAHRIAVTEFGGRINARFDSVYVAGLNYRISEIYRLSREDARTYY